MLERAVRGMLGTCAGETELVARLRKGALERDADLTCGQHAVEESPQAVLVVDAGCLATALACLGHAT